MRLIVLVAALCIGSANAGVDITRKGKFLVFESGVILSSHAEEKEAYEAAINHAFNNGNGTYRIVPPQIEVKVEMPAVVAPAPAPAPMPPAIEDDGIPNIESGPPFTTCPEEGC